MLPDSALRELTFSAAVCEATKICMQEDKRVILMGLGVSDPKAVFGTVEGLLDHFGADRVIEMPTSEAANAGIAVGAALSGLRPIVVHQRVEFALLSIDAMVTQAANWHFMTGGIQRVPSVTRLIVGRGWGQGPQHSQSLESWFAHIPGLKVVAPSTPSDAKGLFIASCRDDTPTIFLESRWVHSVTGPVPGGLHVVPIGRASVLRRGTDLTIVAYSLGAIEARIAADHLAAHGISAEVIDLRSLRPLDVQTVAESVARTQRLLCVDLGWSEFGISSEVISQVAMSGIQLKAPPQRRGVAPAPIASTPALANHSYPGVRGIVQSAQSLVGRFDVQIIEGLPEVQDVPHPSFTGPF